MEEEKIIDAEIVDETIKPEKEEEVIDINDIAKDMGLMQEDLNKLEESFKMMSSGENLIKESINKMSAKDKKMLDDLGMSNEDIEDIIMKGESIEATLDKVNRRKVVEVLDNNPNILPIIFDIVEESDKYDYTITKDGLTYRIKSELKKLSDTIKTYKKTDNLDENGDALLEPLDINFYIPDFDLIEEKIKKEIEISENDLSVLYNTIYTTVNLLHKEWLAEYGMQSVRDVEENILNKEAVEDVLESIKAIKDINTLRMSPKYYEKKIDKALSKQSKELKGSDMIDVLKLVSSIFFEEDSTEYYFMYLYLLKLINNNLSGKELLYIIVFISSIQDLCNYLILNTKEDKTEEEDKIIAELKDKLDINTVVKFITDLIPVIKEIAEDNITNK